MVPLLVNCGNGSNNLISQKLTELHNFYIIDIFKGKYVNFENFEIMFSSDYLRHDRILTTMKSGITNAAQRSSPI